MADKRYGLARALFSDSSYVFGDIFDIVPKTVVSRDLDMNYHLFTRRTEDPGRFTLKEMIKMAGLFGVAPEILCERVLVAAAAKREPDTRGG